MSDNDRIAKNIEHHVIATSMVPWNRKERDNLDIDPERASSAWEVIDRWFGCRVTTFDVGLGQVRYGLTDDEVRHLAEHIEKYIAHRTREGS